jgi:hypothetical protein
LGVVQLQGLLALAIAAWAILIRHPTVGARALIGRTGDGWRADHEQQEQDTRANHADAS